MHAVHAGKLSLKTRWPAISRQMLQSDSEASEDSSEADGSITAAPMKHSQAMLGPAHASHTLSTEGHQQLGQHQQQQQQQPQPWQASSLQAGHTLSTDKKLHASTLQTMHTLWTEGRERPSASRLQARPVTSNRSAVPHSSDEKALALGPGETRAAIHIECSSAEGRAHQRHCRAARISDAGRQNLPVTCLVLELKGPWQGRAWHSNLHEMSTTCTRFYCL